MYAPSFEYLRASSVAEAQQLLAAHPGAKLLAGGHSLLPMLKLRLAAPTALIDIGRIGALKGVSVAGSELRIGAMTTHHDVASSALVAAHCSMVRDAAAHIGDMAVRNRGTIGGSVAHADPAADLPTVLVAAGATVEIAGANGQTQRVAAADFFLGMMTTALGDGDILTAILVPQLTSGSGGAYAKFSHPASRYAVVGAAATVTVSAGVCSRAVVAVGGATAAPTRLASVEAALVGSTLSAEVIAAASTKAAADLPGDLLGDLFASAEYRRHIAGTYVARAVTAAAERARA